MALGDAPAAVALQVLAAVCTPAQLRTSPHAAAFAALAHGGAARSGDATTEVPAEPRPDSDMRVLLAAVNPSRWGWLQWALG